jgi:hypothetical protein
MAGKQMKLGKYQQPATKSAPQNQQLKSPPRVRQIHPLLIPSNNCRICGRDLTNPISIRRGIGPVCWKKMCLPVILAATNVFDQGAQTNVDSFPPMEDHLAKITSWECPNCEIDLHDGKTFHFRSIQGVRLHGFHDKQQIIVQCLDCGVNIRIETLGA